MGDGVLVVRDSSVQLSLSGEVVTESLRQSKIRDAADKSHGRLMSAIRRMARRS